MTAPAPSRDATGPQSTETTDRDESGSSAVDRSADAGEPPEPETTAELAPVIELDDGSFAGGWSSDWFMTTFRAAIDEIDVTVERIGLRLVNDAAMTALHASWCDLDSTTDVLTFPMSGPDEPIDVDIAICLDEARRQATIRGHAVEREVLLYAIHGVLHVVGHDDHDPDSFERMHAEEDRILEAIGVGRTYHDGTGDGRRDGTGAIAEPPS